MNDVVSKSVKPSDCVLAFGIPTTRDDFERARKEPKNREFVVNCCPSWEDYELEVVSEIDNTVPNIERLGVRVVRNLTLSMFGKLFEEQSTRVIVLFCHGDASNLEFDDGLATADQVVEQIPENSAMIIDLCACSAFGPAKAIIKQRPSCLTKFVEVSATPSYWLYFYWALFKMLSDKDLDYTDALAETVDLFVE